MHMYELVPVGGLNPRWEQIDNLVAPLMFGGGQEKKLRPGTENEAGIVGLAKALELAQKNREEESKRLTELRDYL